MNAESLDSPNGIVIMFPARNGALPNFTTRIHK